MTFIQVEFLAFFGIVYTAYWLVGDRRVQNAILAVASAIFYGWVHPWFLLLLYGSAVLDYFMGRAMRERPEHAKLWLTLSMCGNLGMLGYFKYVDFFLENVSAVLTSLGFDPGIHTLGVFLPVGISFYTFQTMSYTLDIYRHELEPRKNFLDYVVFVSFFPQLVAGPVERARNLLPQMEVDRVFSWGIVRSGFALAAWGTFKKVCVADVVAPYVDRVFILQDPAGPLIVLGAVGFSIQILADFSGYTDIARGIARMMGFELMENFKNPYMAVDPSDFWRRWHISFSTWIRDYIYIPVGGSRGGFWGTTWSTFTAMLISGLWHGASWNFVIWGGFHAALITGYRLAKRRIPKPWRQSTWGHAVAIVLMYGFTCLGWLIFRETHLDRLIAYLTTNPFTATHAEWVTATTLSAVLLVTATPLVLKLFYDLRIKPWLERTPWHLPAETTAWTVMALLVISLHRATGNDFIYFQF